MIFGINSILYIPDSTENYLVRKAFHFLGFLLFAPAIAYSIHQSPRLLAFAFNSVTVFLIVLESARYFDLLPDYVSKWFKYYCNGFEKRKETLIITHIYLIMGMSFPFISTFILIDGGVFPSNWALYSLSGAIFLGIGDSAAAICGKWWGSRKWRENSNKTQEGSTYCIYATLIVYFIFCYVID